MSQVGQRKLSHSQLLIYTHELFVVSCCFFFLLFIDFWFVCSFNFTLIDIVRFLYGNICSFETRHTTHECCDLNYFADRANVEWNSKIDSYSEWKTVRVINRANATMAKQTPIIFPAIYYLHFEMYHFHRSTVAIARLFSFRFIFMQICFFPSHFSVNSFFFAVCT